MFPHTGQYDLAVARGGPRNRRPALATRPRDSWDTSFATMSKVEIKMRPLIIPLTRNAADRAIPVLIIVVLTMMVMVPPRTVILPIVAWPAVMVVSVVIARIILGIVVSGSEGKAEVHACFGRFWSEDSQPKSGDPNNKKAFHLVMFFRKKIRCRN
jgi:hypothetical protein